MMYARGMSGGLLAMSLGVPMAKKAAKRRGPVPKRPEKMVQVRVDAELHRKLAVLAALWGTETTSIVDDLLRGPVERHFQREVKGGGGAAPGAGEGGAEQGGA